MLLPKMADCLLITLSYASIMVDRANVYFVILPLSFWLFVAPSTSNNNITQLTSQPHRIYNSQLCLVPYSISIWKSVKSATRGILSRLETRKH